MKHAGRRALVTGGGSGIGRAVALDLAREGCAVWVAGRRREPLEAVVEEAARAGGKAEAVTADVSRVEDVRALFRTTGRVDILVNGAGIAVSAPLARTSDELWRSILETNLSGAFYCLREAIPAMVERGWGRVVNVASVAGKAGAAYIAAYAASKHGLLGLTRAAAQELADKGVTVNAVCPGYVDTPMTDQNLERMSAKTGRSVDELRRHLEAMSPQKRLFTSEEVSALVVYLCGEEARGINGQALSLDGGMVP
ncbi:MAG TPA: 3-oxoacyl-ACP reductase FabG [Vicinamibacteria bacterium]|jgi:NAD(P)-dependent dehydrogenase (short-subunit alcohol dehydrogenase family)